MAPKTRGSKGKKADANTIRIRQEELLRILLDGAETWDVREYIREKEKDATSAWFLKKGQQPLSDAQMWNYLRRVREQIRESCKAEREDMVALGMAQRRSLYARAVAQADVKAALAVLKDIAELAGLYPDKDAELKDMIRTLTAKTEALGGGNHGTGGGSPSAQAVDRVPGADGDGGGAG